MTKTGDLSRPTSLLAIQINNIYANGRLEQIQTPEGNIDLTYLCSTKVESMTKGPESITYGYDGKLVTSMRLWQAH